MENREKKEKLELRLEVIRFANEDVIAASGIRGKSEESNTKYIKLKSTGGFERFGSFTRDQ